MSVQVERVGDERQMRLLLFWNVMSLTGVPFFIALLIARTSRAYGGRR